MSIKENEVRSGRMVYSCNCGWIDTGHVNPAAAKKLWKQIATDHEPWSKQAGANGFKVTFGEYQGVPSPIGALLSNGVTKEYFVRATLTPQQRESVALAIFIEVSTAFEAYQENGEYWGIRVGPISGGSSFSQEDLISDLIGFYSALRPGIKYEKICDVRKIDESMAVFNKMTVLEREAKSHDANSPVLYKCDACSGGSFPDEFKSISPATKGGKNLLFRNWTKEDAVGPSLPIVRMVPQNLSQGIPSVLKLRDGLKIRAHAVANKNPKF